MDLSWVSEMSNGVMDAPEPQGKAIALGNRLLTVEETTLALRGEITRLRREVENGGGSGGGGGWFEPPRARFAWRRAEEPDSATTDFSPYDHRVDDSVIIEGERGKLFLNRFDLEGDTPDFTAAVAALNAMPRVLRVLGDGAAETPDVSIVIPIYGQLAYTLNCLESLFRQDSQYSAELIVIDDCSPDVSGSYLPEVADIRYHLQPKNGGFIRSCNTGGAMARGRFVLMLNNDTRVVPGWLDGLLDSFSLFPKAGLVGSKLFYADGSLQEAGGIIWRNGNCWNYGRNDDPNRPEYSHARQVDYISGCSIVLPTSLWHALGGFDPLFTPAYCEDADLCLRIAALGYEVWMQPQSRIVHYEGKTSGTDTGKGVKAYQITNTRKLYLRWREKLETHRRDPEAPYSERERSVRRRILVVDVSAPTPNQDAGSVQTVLALKVCHRLGYKAHFVAEDNWLFQDRYTTDLQKTGVECAYAPYDLGFTNYIRRYGHLFDAILVYRYHILERVIDDIRAYAKDACLLFHVADLHFLRQQREAELAGDSEKQAEAAEVKARELAIIAAADCTITHSTIEAEVLASELPGAPVAVWPLMYEVFGTSQTFAERRDICFLGGYRHTPNVDAVMYFISDIFPLIRAADPSIRFIIAGANAPQSVRELAGDGIEFVGLVEDLRDLFDRCRVFVCPLRYGAGAKGKVMSALSYGLPIVSSAIGVEGAGLADEEHVLVADSPEDFASATLRLYNDETLWNRLSRAGQVLLEEHFSTGMGAQVLNSAIDRAHAARMSLAPDQHVVFDIGVAQRNIADFAGD
ncbi:MAG TPA: glycosyltransferase [Acidisoma sp.]|uniref:glycosyltransferase n=1 Tax=Acidisoma sp. TaxID=1872115 RepID=UPI002BA207B6|nr:glycosyltransferase [Acidisoma sp.]HTH99302.1 glycosyltransferase [Acidisoma sp.]